jgi:hypothetical protein
MPKPGEIESRQQSERPTMRWVPRYSRRPTQPAPSPVESLAERISKRPTQRAPSIEEATERPTRRAPQVVHAISQRPTRRAPEQPSAIREIADLLEPPLRPSDPTHVVARIRKAVPPVIEPTSRRRSPATLGLTVAFVSAVALGAALAMMTGPKLVELIRGRSANAPIEGAVHVVSVSEAEQAAFDSEYQEPVAGSELDSESDSDSEPARVQRAHPDEIVVGGGPQVRSRRSASESESASESDPASESESDSASDLSLDRSRASDARLAQLAPREIGTLAPQGHRVEMPRAAPIEERSVERVRPARAALDPGAVRAVIQGQQHRLRQCYTTAIRRHGMPADASVRMNIGIDVEGFVSELALEGPDFGGLHRCLRSTALRWRFPASSDGGRVPLPLSFRAVE